MLDTINREHREYRDRKEVWERYSRCSELIKDLEQVAYKPGTGIVNKDSDLSRTHLADALGYLVWMENRPLRKVGEQRQRIM